MVFAQYVDCVPSLHAVDEALGSVGLRWAETSGETDESRVDSSVKGNDCTVTGETVCIDCFRKFSENLACSSWK